MLQERPPIITIMGHVDHGKTTLLDYIRKTRVQAGEVGGITQHIGAYQISFKDKKITFIDTPGHAAFNKMRERGVKTTDIVILVVAANDGIKPQTLESLRYIREAKVPFIVAINKIDLEGVRSDTVKGQLAQEGVLVQEYGGEIEAVEISAKTGKGVDQLLDTVLVMADLLELKADPTKPLEAIVIESAKDRRRGNVASVIVKAGTLKVRQDIFVEAAGQVVKGRVRQLSNERGEQLSEVLPGGPAEIIGLNDLVEVGSLVKEAGADYAHLEEEVADSAEQNLGLDFANLDFGVAFGDKQKLKLLIKADVKGTLEAILQTLDLDTVDLVSSGVGMVTDQDLELAQTSGALVIVFGQKVDRKTKDIAKQMGVKIKEYDIIYHLLEDLQKQMLKILEPTIDEVVTGEAEILQVFEMKGEKIAGVRVKTGSLKRHDLFHLKRNDEIVGNPVVRSMKHGKDDILEVNTKNEAGLTFKNKSLDFRVGDTIVAYKKEEE